MNEAKIEKQAELVRLSDRLNALNSEFNVSLDIITERLNMITYDSPRDESPDPGRKAPANFIESMDLLLSVYSELNSRLNHITDRFKDLVG